MPPKATAKKKEEKKDVETAVVVEKVLPTEREIQLKKQLDNLTEELKNSRKQLEILQQENEFLQQEAQQVRVETHEYLAFMSKKTQKRQSAVISLSDHNAEQIREINKKKEEKLVTFKHEKEELSNTILVKETELNSIKKELNDLHEYQILQENQESEILQLEKAVADMRVKHNEAVQKLKAKFLEDKNTFEAESVDELNELSKEAKKEAYQCLQDHAIKIKHENRALRKELLDLIKRTRAMHKHKLSLEDQRKALLCEKEYTAKLCKMKQERDDTLYQTFGVTQKEPSQ